MIPPRGLPRRGLPRRRSSAALMVTLALGASLLACEDPPTCEEDIRAQVLDDFAEVTFDGRVVIAELADDEVERERGWRHRRCDREAIVLVPDTPPEPTPIWGCGLVDPIDAVFIAAGSVAAVERVDPCPEPCGSCVSVGEGLSVDAVVELPIDPARPPPPPGSTATIGPL